MAGINQQEPGTKRRVHETSQPEVPPRPPAAPGDGSRSLTECIMLDGPRGRIEQDGPQAGNEAHQDRQAQQPGLGANPTPAQQ